MSWTTDALLFALLLVVFAAWMALAFDHLGDDSVFFAAAGLLVGAFALLGRFASSATAGD